MATIAITGVNQGFPQRLMRCYLGNGHNVVGIVPGGTEMRQLKEIERESAGLELLDYNLTTQADIDRLVTHARLRSVDLLIHGARELGPRGGLNDSQTLSEWNRLHALNVASVSVLTHGLISNLSRARSSQTATPPRVVILISKLANSFNASSKEHPLHATRLARLSLVMNLAASLQEEGIVVAGIDPRLSQRESSPTDDPDIVSVARKVHDRIDALTMHSSGRVMDENGDPVWPLDVIELTRQIEELKRRGDATRQDRHDKRGDTDDDESS